MLLLIDHLALRARNYEYLIRLFQEWEVGTRLSLPVSLWAAAASAGARAVGGGAPMGRTHTRTHTHTHTAAVLTSRQNCKKCTASPLTLMVMACCSGAVLGLGLSVKVVTFISCVLFLIRRLENMFLLDGAVSEMCDPDHLP